MDSSKDNFTIQKELLERFILYNPELEKLEAMLSEFNMFETLNMVNAEIRHSNMLAWLMNPLGNHGLGSYFIHNFLKQVVVENKSSIDSLSIFDIENMDYGDVGILREWRNIDILITIGDGNKLFVFIIENKIKSSEHSNQLARYYEIVEKNYPKAEKLYIYLTPDNSDPSEESWISFSYASIVQLLDNILKYRRESLGDNIYSIIDQYIQILKRYHVGQSEIEKICTQIYNKHKDALDLIFEYKPDIQNEISEHLQSLIRNQENMIIDGYGKSLVRFATLTTEKVFPKIGEGWTKSNRIVLYQFIIRANSVVLRLSIGPGDQGFRSSLNEYCKIKKTLFNKSNRTPGPKYHCIYQIEFLNKKNFEDSESEELFDKINKKWNAFITKDMIEIDSYFENWESDS